MDNEIVVCNIKNIKNSILRGKKDPSKISRTDSLRTCIDCCYFGGAYVSWKDAQKATLLLQPDFSSTSFILTSVPITHRTPYDSKYNSRTTGFKFRIEQDDANNN